MRRVKEKKLMNDNIVIYTKCPHCHKGWYGELINKESHVENGQEVLDSLVIKGINPTELTKSIQCLNCHREYVPAHYAVAMDQFVAERLTTCKGH